MKIASNGKHIMIGLPHSGKSTFIGALWHVVESEELPDALRLHSLGEDREYIETLREAWLTCTKPERNKLEDRHFVSMQLKQADSEEVVELIFPDLAGELFEQQWRDRIWTQDYARLVQEATGILIFVHAEHQHKPRLLLDIPQDVRSSGEETPVKIFDKDKVPLQTQIVETIQFIAEYVVRKEAFRVAVIISAWDEVEKTNVHMGDQTPKDYLATHVPLLHQYLIANPDKFDTQVFGVSAQGGDFKDDVDKLRKFPEQSNRIIVRVGNDVTPDITLPIKWLMKRLSF